MDRRAQILITLGILIVLLTAVLKFAPIKQANEAYDIQSLTATPEAPGEAILSVKENWLIGGILTIKQANLPKIVTLNVFEPDGKTVALNESFDYQHTSNPYLLFNFTAKVAGDYLFSLNATFESVPDSYVLQREITMELSAYEQGMSTIF